MRTKARSVAVIVFDEVELLDLAAPLEVLSAAGRRWNFRPYKVTVLASRAGLVSTRGQLRVEASSGVDVAEPAEVVVVPGGYGARRAAADEALVQHVARLATSAELVAGVGLGVLLLAKAGLCGGARVAAAPELEPELAALSGELVVERTEPLIRDGRLITARNSGQAIPLALAIVGATMGPKLVSMVSADLGLEPDSPAKIEIRY